MGRTQRKLAEAKFFLRKIEDSYYTMIDEFTQEPALPFYVSAFLSAARSVAWIMRSEYGRIEGWEEWYQAQEPSSANAVLLRVFAELRNSSQKSQPYQMSLRLFASPRAEAPRDSKGRPLAKNRHLSRYRVVVSSVDDVDGEPPIEVDAVLDDLQIWLPELGNDAELRDSCRRYVKLLEDLVNRCEERFGV